MTASANPCSLVRATRAVPISALPAVPTTNSTSANTQATVGGDVGRKSGCTAVVVSTAFVSTAHSLYTGACAANVESVSRKAHAGDRPPADAQPALAAAMHHAPQIHMSRVLMSINITKVVTCRVGFRHDRSLRRGTAVRMET